MNTSSEFLSRAAAAFLTVMLAVDCSSTEAPAATPPPTTPNLGTPSANVPASTAGTPAAGASGSPVSPPTGKAGATAGGGVAGTGVAPTGQAGVAGVAAASGTSGTSGTSGATAGMAAVGGAGSGAGAGGSAPSTAGPMMAWPPVADFSKNGAFKPTTKNNSGPMGAYTLFYPTDLGKEGLKHPVITWGNGALTTPSSYNAFLPVLASQGFFIIAANTSSVTPEAMQSGLDWALAQNDATDSPFYQKLDPSKVAAMGYSLGSIGTFGIAAGPHIVTTVHISGGAMDKATVPNLKHPAAFFCGSDADIAHDNCESDFDLAKVPVFYGVFPGDHLGILGTHTAQILKAVGAWLRWRLMDDLTLAPTFVGPDCTLCMDKDWVIKQKDFATAPPP